MTETGVIARGTELAGRAARIREELAESFSMIHSQVCETADSLDSFIRMMDPYVNYFFTGEKGDDSFLGDVITPAETDLVSATNNAVGIMEGDLKIHKTIFESLSRTLLLQDYVERVVELLEMMEIYSINTMIISAKAGGEGASLTTISTHMAALSRKGNELSALFTGKMHDLRNSLDVFSRLSDKIEMMHETNLTTIQLSSSIMFKNLISEFTRLSAEVIGVYGMIKNVSDAVRGVTEKFQYEDLLRQDLEKTIFAAQLSEDAEECSRIADAAGCDVSKVSDFVLLLASEKFRDVAEDIGRLKTELTGSMDKVQSVITAFDSIISETGRQNGTGGKNSAEALQSLCDRLEWMKDEFSKYIESVIELKLDLSGRINDVNLQMNGFSDFFKSILGISQQFQTILLMTRIELARYDKLKSLLGGTLSDVGSIPVDIRRVIEELIPLYEDVLASLGGASALYRERFDEQKQMLDSCVGAMRKVSVQIYESKKYHDDFLAESERCSSSVRTFLESESSSIRGFVSAQGDLSTSFPDGSVSEEKYRMLSGALKGFFSPGVSSGDYRSMMLVSLVAEKETGKAAAGGTIDFF
jgi:hypothetical protein